MILSAESQAEIFMLSFMLGVCCGFFYDVIKAVRIAVPHRRFVCEMEDGLYWAVCAIFVVKFMLENNSGEIRLFSAAAFFVAMLVYHLFVSFAIRGLLEETALIFKKAVSALVQMIMMPFKLVWHILRPPAKKAQNKMKKTGYTVLILIKKYVKIKLITLRAVLCPNKK